jgi:hypothetical protein
MGEIIFWTIIRAALTIPTIWILKDFIDYQLWWIVAFSLIYGVIVHPAMIHYRLFEERNKEIINSTLCSSCKHFDQTAVLCTKHDKHPTINYLPCEGIDWEMKPVSANEENQYID